jgi:hypothetical protein
MRTHNNISLSERDLNLTQIEKEIRSKKELLLKKKNDLKEKTKLNDFLNNVREDYKKYYDYIIEEKQKQISALTVLKEYLGDLARTENVVNSQIRTAKHDQNYINLEIEKIKKELDKIIQTNNE